MKTCLMVLIVLLFAGTARAADPAWPPLDPHEKQSLIFAMKQVAGSVHIGCSNPEAGSWCSALADDLDNAFAAAGWRIERLAPQSIAAWNARMNKGIKVVSCGVNLDAAGMRDLMQWATSRKIDIITNPTCHDVQKSPDIWITIGHPNP